MEPFISSDRFMTDFLNNLQFECESEFSSVRAQTNCTESQKLRSDMSMARIHVSDLVYSKLMEEMELNGATITKSSFLAGADRELKRVCALVASSPDPAVMYKFESWLKEGRSEQVGIKHSLGLELLDRLIDNTKDLRVENQTIFENCLKELELHHSNSSELCSGKAKTAYLDASKAIHVVNYMDKIDFKAGDLLKLYEKENPDIKKYSSAFVIYRLISNQVTDLIFKPVNSSLAAKKTLLNLEAIAGFLGHAEKNYEYLDAACSKSSRMVELWDSWISGERVTKLVRVNGKYTRLNISLDGPPCTEKEIPKLFGFTTCCAHSNIIAELNRTQLWTFVQKNTQSASLTWKLDDFMDKLSKKSLQSFRYHFRRSQESVISKNPRIFYCTLKRDDLGTAADTDRDSCEDFLMNYSDDGVAYTFNSAPFFDRFQRRPTMESFASDFIKRSDENWPRLRYPRGIGPSNGLHLALKVDEMDPFLAHKENREQMKLKRFIKVALHDPSAFPELRDGFVKIQPGYEYTFLVTPHKTFSTEGVRSLGLSQRKCRFPDESEGLEIFKEYSQERCYFECVLSMARAKCRCNPWNYPDPGTSPTCDFMGNYCFETSLRNVTLREKCD